MQEALRHFQGGAKPHHFVVFPVLNCNLTAHAIFKVGEKTIICLLTSTSDCQLLRCCNGAPPQSAQANGWVQPCLPPHTHNTRTPRPTTAPRCGSSASSPSRSSTQWCAAIYCSRPRQIKATLSTDIGTKICHSDKAGTKICHSDKALLVVPMVCASLASCPAGPHYTHIAYLAFHFGSAGEPRRDAGADNKGAQVRGKTLGLTSFWSIVMF